VTITLQNDEYDALLVLARAGAEAGSQVEVFFNLRKQIDFANGLRRTAILVRYDTLPWVAGKEQLYGPRGETLLLELLRPPTREDVMIALSGKRTAPALIHVTRDPNGVVGWYELDLFPWG
jgi:hypothetical protein